jgi:hypothetical protein
MSFPRALMALVFSAGLAAAADPVLLNLVMKDPLMVAGLDVDRARSSPFGQRILAEMKDEDAEFQKLLSATGFDPRRDLREVVLASTGGTSDGHPLVVVRGTFDPGRIGNYLQAEGAKSLGIYKGVQIWGGKNSQPNNEGAFAFLDSSLAVFGKTADVQGAIDRRLTNTGGLSPGVGSKVAQWSGNDAWFVSTASLATLGVGKDGKNGLLPGGVPTDAIREAAAGVRFGSMIELNGELLARSDQDANALADVFRFITAMIRLNADKPGMEDALKLANSLQVSTTGSTVKFSMAVSEEQLGRMLNAKRRPGAQTVQR